MDEENDLDLEPGSCGFFCVPARWPESCLRKDQTDCIHDEASHYSIDGENVGCLECEEWDA